MANIVEFFKTSKSYLFKPVDTVKQLKTQDYTYIDSIIIGAIFSAFFSLLFFLLNLLILKGNIIFGLIGAVISFLGGTIGFFISIFLYGGVYYLIAKVLGGKPPKFATFLYSFLVYAFSIVIFSIIGAIISMVGSFIPVIGIFISLIVSLAIFLGSSYFLTVLIRESFELSTLKAIAVWVIPFIIAILSVVLFVGSILGTLLGAFVPKV